MTQTLDQLIQQRLDVEMNLEEQAIQFVNTKTGTIA